MVGCFALARRKFKEAEQAAGKNKTGRANWALSHIQKLYRIEKAIKDLIPEGKYEVRQNQAKPLLEQYKQWLDKICFTSVAKGANASATLYSIIETAKANDLVTFNYPDASTHRAPEATRRL